VGTKSRTAAVSAVWNQRVATCRSTPGFLSCLPTVQFRTFQRNSPRSLSPPSLCSFASLSLYFCLSLHVLRDRWLVRSYLNSRSSCGIHLAPCTVCAPFDSKVSNSECTSQWKSSRDDQHISQQRNKQTSANSGLPFGFGRGIERVGGKDVIFSRFASASAKRRRTEFAEDSALSLDP